MSPLRVLHLVPSFAGGGAERQLGYLAIAQAEMGLDTHVGYVYGGPNLELITGRGVHLHKLTSLGNNDPLLVMKIAKLIRMIQPSVVQTWLRQMDVFGGLAARLSKVPWVLSERASAEHYRGWKNALRKRVAGGVTAVVANSDVGLAYWRDLPLSTKRRTIRNIVPLQAIADASPVPFSASDVLQEGGQIILAAGRLDPQKNWFVLLDALELILRKRPSAHAVLFGEGYLRAEVAHKVGGLSCADRIHLRGYSNNLWGWLKRASLYVSVSHFEGTPNVLLEALACACPVVVSDIPSHREVVSAAEADFVPVGSPTVIADAIDRALSVAGRSKVGNPAALERLRRWSAPIIADEYRTLYREIIGSDPQGYVVEAAPPQS